LWIEKRSSAEVRGQVQGRDGTFVRYQAIKQSSVLFMSAVEKLLCYGVPQGSTLTPLLVGRAWSPRLLALGTVLQKVDVWDRPGQFTISPLEWILRIWLLQNEERKQNAKAQRK
ncbi:hypothetical protein J6590_035978, partial [Homalodisca vitripennis]